MDKKYSVPQKHKDYKGNVVYLTYYLVDLTNKKIIDKQLQRVDTINYLNKDMAKKNQKWMRWGNASTYAKKTNEAKEVLPSTKPYQGWANFSTWNAFIWLNHLLKATKKEKLQQTIKNSEDLKKIYLKNFKDHNGVVFDHINFQELYTKMIEGDAIKENMLRSLIRQVLKEDWYSDLSDTEQKQYLHDHPHSKKAKEIKSTLHHGDQQGRIQQKIKSGKATAYDLLNAHSNGHKTTDTMKGFSVKDSKTLLNIYDMLDDNGKDKFNEFKPDQLKRVLANIRKQVSENKKTKLNETKKPKKYYILKQNFRGDMGNAKKGEIFSFEGQSEDDPESWFMYLANPNYEYYTDVNKKEFDKVFQLVDNSTPKAMAQLNKWGLVDFGDAYYVISVSLDKDNPNIKSAIEAALKKPKNSYGFIKQTAESPKQAIKRAGHNVGTLEEPAAGVWVAKMYAQWAIMATKEDPTTIGVDKLTNLVKKSGVIKEPIKESSDNKYDYFTSEIKKINPNAKIKISGNNIDIQLILSKIGSTNINLKWSSDGENFRWNVKIKSRTNWAEFVAMGETEEEATTSFLKGLSHFRKTT